jgi:hypothetical protein
LLQTGRQKSAKIAGLVASEYVASQTPLAIKQAVEELLHQHYDEDGGEEKLCKMIIDKILQRRMSESSFVSSSELHTSWFLFIYRQSVAWCLPTFNSGFLLISSPL